MAEQENLNPVVIPDSAINQTYPSLPGTEPTISIVNHPDLDKKEETPPSKKVSRQILSGVINSATQSQIISNNNIIDNDYTMDMDNHNNTQNNTDDNDTSMNIPKKPEPQIKNNNDISGTRTNTVQHFLPSPSNSPSSGPDTPQEQLLNDTIMPDLEPQTSNNTMITNNNSNNNGTINDTINDNDNIGNNGMNKDSNTNHNDNISHITHDSNSNTSNKNININNNNNINVTHSGSNNGNHNPTNIRKRRSSSITSQNGRATKRLKIERRIRDRSWEAQALKQFEKLAKTLKAEW
eukprot:CAMPEP_0114658100 /NCGR_PEP_ID=MMETSP0191-20121206/15092_1 /TAXON_ID=126664 /ORGANISM="Sorites sp." /LENGTH=293 /DNA_ID=CAMNT_0001879149 /DNA_START=19 /DNA_END=897 /DNA_ORIENTATION=+